MGTSRTYRYRPRRWLLLLMLLAVLFLALIFGMFARLLWHAFQISREIPTAILERDFPGFAWKSILTLLCFGFSLALNTWALFQSYLEFNRVSISVGDEGLVFTDWRNRRREIRWDDVREVRIWLSTQVRIPPTWVMVGGCKLVIPRFHFEDREALIDEIIAHSGLAKTSDSFLRTSYTRTGTATAEA